MRFRHFAPNTRVFIAMNGRSSSRQTFVVGVDSVKSIEHDGTNVVIKTDTDTVVFTPMGVLTGPAEEPAPATKSAEKRR